MGAELYAEAVRLCESYNPETRLVVYVSVCVVREVPSGSVGAGPVMWERQPVSRCAKLKLEASCRGESTNKTTTTTTQRLCNTAETLVLKSNPLLLEDDDETKRQLRRELCLTNVQRQLALRGVSLERHFPQVYNKLQAYVAGINDKLAPTTIYPRDQNTGRSFACIIMLDAKPEKLQLLPNDSSIRIKSVDVGSDDMD